MYTHGPPWARVGVRVDVRVREYNMCSGHDFCGLLLYKKSRFEASIVILIKISALTSKKCKKIGHPL